MSDETRTRDTAALIAGLRTLSSLEEKMPDGSWREYGIHPTLSAAADALEASEAARANLEAVIASIEDWRSWYAGGAGYPSVGEWLELGRRLKAAGDPVVLREHRVCTDLEQHAASFNEGFETAVAQGLADDPEKADEWLREHDAKVLREYADALEANRSAEVWDKESFVRDVREWASYRMENG